MFTTLFAIVAAPLLARALTFTSPTSDGVTGNTTVTISWTTAADDPTSFTIELVNPTVGGPLARGPIAIATNIKPDVKSISINLPVVPPGGDYTMEFVKIDDINTVFATSDTFSISDNPLPETTTTSAPSTSSGGPSATIGTVPNSQSTTATRTFLSETPSVSGSGSGSSPSPTPDGAAHLTVGAVFPVFASFFAIFLA